MGKRNGELWSERREVLSRLDWKGWNGGIAGCPRPLGWTAHSDASNCHAVLGIKGEAHPWIFISGATYNTGTFFANNANLKTLGLAAAFAQGTVVAYSADHFGMPGGVDATTPVELYE